MQDDSTLSPLQSFFHNKWVRLCLIFDTLLLLVLIGVLIWQSTKVSTINFDIAPLDSAISINGKQYANGQYSITPGSYKVTISHEGLEAKTFDINISPQNSVSISTFLSDKEKTFDFYQQRANYMSYKKLEEIASSNNNITTDYDTSAESFITRFQEDYEAFTTKLPIDYSETVFHDGFYEIKNSINVIAKDDCAKTLCLQVHTTSTNNEESIKAQIQEKGINVEDFEIEYKFY